MEFKSNIKVALFILLTAACKEKTLFTKLSSSETGITFNNIINETADLNPLKEVNIYNGGGVGVGDFNGDGLQDLYFTGNTVSNKLYLNKGNIKFEDATSVSKTDASGKWCRGVSVVDINNDGKPDLYISVSMDRDAAKRENLLYINQGNDKNGVPVFKELASEYGLNDSTHTTMAHFFDYDNDGDLDVYLIVNVHVSTENQNTFRPIHKDGSHPSTGRLYRNDWNDQLHHGKFIDVSAEAGIMTEGYGHSAIISDFNRDGWKDIYVTNDFISNNLLYINNGDATFTDRAKEYFKQTSTFAMGVDMQDINNDGLLDVVELDMNPEDNYRKKMMLGPNSYQTVKNFEKYNYQYQYSRNTLQLNQGPRVGENDSIGAPVFSQIGFLSGMAETDWSWTPLLADLDDDGFRDLLVTNGFPKDVTDHDFMIYRARASAVAPQEEILRQVPEVKLSNYAFRNNGNLVFENRTEEWGLNEASFSNGAVYADLDNDGDMELIVNNINDEAFVYKNNTDNSVNHYLNISFSGDSLNVNGFGTWLDIYYDGGKHQVYEHTPYRGYLSSVAGISHFGLGSTSNIDSVVVRWQNGKKQVLGNVKTNQVLNVNIKNAELHPSWPAQTLASGSLFSDISSSLGIKYKHREKDYVDFNVQKLLPHKFSEYSPALAAGDIDGNGLDDIVCSGNSLTPATLFLQQQDGKFIERKLFPPGKDSLPRPYGKYGILTQLDFKDSGLLLFDADGDKDLDLYISSGGFEHDPGTLAYQDRLYVNDGYANFTLDKSALPENFTSKFCVRAADYDKDGDLDVFVAGRVEPWGYPKPVSSFIFRNDSKNGTIKFTDVTNSVAAGLVNIGLVCDAVFTDFNNDGWQDIILAGEWMPLTLFKNEQGKFNNISQSAGIVENTGWWNSIAPGDFDNDGDIDYIVGNLGLNSLYKASPKYPAHITAGYFDNNLSYDAVPSLYFPVSHQDKTVKEFPVHQLEDMNKQMIGMRAIFTNFRTYANTTMDKLFNEDQREDALRLEATMLSSAYVRNDGNNTFTMMALPILAQVSVLNGMIVDDFDGDNNLDVAINGNDYGTEVSVGRYDALNGLILKGDGKGGFYPLSILESGMYIPGNGKALVRLRGANGKYLLAASQNNGPLKIFSLKKSARNVQRTRKTEIYFGYSFLSQSAL